MFRQGFKSTGYVKRLFTNLKGVSFKSSDSTKSGDMKKSFIPHTYKNSGDPRCSNKDITYGAERRNVGQSEDIRQKPSESSYSQKKAEPKLMDRSEQSGKFIVIGGVIIFLIAGAGVLYWLDDFCRDKSKPIKKSSKHEHKDKKKEEQFILKDPLNSSDIPNNVRYLLIGGGTSSFAAFTAIRSADPDAKVLVISREPHYPYMRFPLSKEMLYLLHDDESNSSFTQWNGMESSVYYEPPEFYSDCKTLKDFRQGGVAVARGWAVKKLDIFEKKAYLEDGYVINYDKCLIATGCTPVTLPSFEEAPKSIQSKIMTYRGIEDTKSLFKDLKQGVKSITIVGGGFLGSELAYSLATHTEGHDLKVSQVFLESGNMGNVLPPYLSAWTMDKMISQGVEIHSNAAVNDVSLDEDKVVLSLNTGEKIKTDKVVLAVGVKPNTELAIESGLETDKQNGGVIVNSELMARSDVWVAGDCSSFFDPLLGRRRVEHHDHAMESGKVAGENMTGAAQDYEYQSMFWSDLGPDIGFEAVGIIDASLPTVGVFTVAGNNDTPKAVVTKTNEADRSKTEKNATSVVPAKDNPETPKTQSDYGKGVIFYLRDDIIVGVLLWNVFHRLSIAREVLRQKKKYKDLKEVAKLFNIHND